MLDHFAGDLGRGRAERAEGERLPAITEKAMVGGVAMLRGLAPEAIQFVLTPYIGGEEARRVGERGGSGPEA